jgi:hypothetical protein
MSFMVVTQSDPSLAENWMADDQKQSKFSTSLDKSKSDLADMYLSDPNLSKYRSSHMDPEREKGDLSPAAHVEKEEDGRGKKSSKKPAEPDATRLFGIPIEVAAKRSDPENWLIPSPIRNAVRYLNEVACDEEGLYRIPGSHAKYLEYKRLFDSGQDVDFLVCERIPQNVAMMVIKYLQELPEPLYTNSLLPRFKKILYTVKEKEKQASLLRKTMEMLPFVNREVFRFLIDHFRFLSLHRSAEQMHGSIMSWGISLGQLMGKIVSALFEKDFCEIPQTIVFGVEFREAARRSHKQACIPSPIRYAAEALLVFRNGPSIFFHPFANFFDSLFLLLPSFQTLEFSISEIKKTALVCSAEPLSPAQSHVRQIRFSLDGGVKTNVFLTSSPLHTVRVLREYLQQLPGFLSPPLPFALFLSLSLPFPS